MGGGNIAGSNVGFSPHQHSLPTGGLTGGVASGFDAIRGGGSQQQIPLPPQQTSGSNAGSQQLNNVFGILPEEAFRLSNSNSRRARLWRKVYYLEYLRELYKR